MRIRILHNPTQRRIIIKAMNNWEEFKNSINFMDDIDKEAIKETAKKVNECVLLRKRLGITQKQLAEITGLSQPVIARFERSNSLPEYKTVMKVSLALEAIKNSFHNEEAASSLIHA